MNLCGETVMHKLFGSGKIVGFADNYVTVLFDNGNAEREFVYPSAFGEFLVLDNSEYEDQIRIDKGLAAQKLAGSRRVSEAPRQIIKPLEPKKAKPKAKPAAARIIAPSPDKDKV